MDLNNDRRIVLLGKTGDGKSSTGNTILEKEAFTVGDGPSSQTDTPEISAKMINGKKYVIIDNPGIFDTKLSDKDITKCITECSPGPHAFLIVLKVGRYTIQEQDVVKKITGSFGEQALKYALVLFTHGKQLKSQTIEEFVGKSDVLNELVQKCGGRCHVIDNEEWKLEHEYKSNKVQVEKLLENIEKMVRQNGGGCYTNEMLKAVENEIQNKMCSIRKRNTNLSHVEVRNIAKEQVAWDIKAAGILTGALLGALMGIPVVVLQVVCARNTLLDMLKLASKMWNDCLAITAGKGVAAASEAVVASEGIGAAGLGTVWAIAASLIIAFGAVVGGSIGATAADDATSRSEAVEKAATALWDEVTQLYYKTARQDKLS